jgi:hypothetical protein
MSAFTTLFSPTARRLAMINRKSLGLSALGALAGIGLWIAVATSGLRELPERVDLGKPPDSPGDKASLPVLAGRYASLPPTANTEEPLPPFILSSVGLLPGELLGAEPRSSEVVGSIGDDGRLRSLAPLRPGLRVKIPGHLAIPFPEEPGDEIVFQPELSLVLVLPGIRDLLTECEVLGTSALQQNVEGDHALAGFAAMDTFAIAVNPDAYRQGSRAPDTTFFLYTKNHYLVAGNLDLDARGNFIYPIDLPNDRPGRVKISLWCADDCDSEITVSLWPSLGGWRQRASHTIYEPWGNLTVQEHGRTETRSIPGRSTSFDVIVGRRYGASAICDNHATYGRVMFSGTQDAEIALSMEHGFRLQGTVSPKEVESIDLAIKFYDPLTGARQLVWYSEVSATVLDGSFEVSLPRKVPIKADAHWPMPGSLKIKARGSLCSPLNLDVEWDGVSCKIPVSFDFESRVDLVITDYESAPDETEFVRYLDHTGKFVEQYIHSAAMVSGELNLRLDRVVDPLPKFLILTDADVSRCFILREDRFVPVPMETRTVSVRLTGLPQGVEAVHIGWSWKGIAQDQYGLFEHHVGDVYEFSLTLPGDPDFLWWSNSRRGLTAAPDPRLLEDVVGEVLASTESQVEIH